MGKYVTIDVLREEFKIFKEEFKEELNKKFKEELDKRFKQELTPIKNSINSILNYIKNESIIQEEIKTNYVKNIYEHSEKYGIMNYGIIPKVKIHPLKYIYNDKGKEISELDGLFVLKYNIITNSNNSNTERESFLEKIKKYNKDSSDYKINKRLSELNINDQEFYNKNKNLMIKTDKTLIIEAKHYFDISHVNEKMKQIIEFNYFKNLLINNYGEYKKGSAFRNMYDVYKVHKLPDDYILFFTGYCNNYVKDYITNIYNGFTRDNFNSIIINYLLIHRDTKQIYKILLTSQNNDILKIHIKTAFNTIKNLSYYFKNIDNLYKFKEEIYIYCDLIKDIYEFKEDMNNLISFCELIVDWNEINNVFSQFKNSIGYLVNNEYFGEYGIINLNN